MSSKITTDLAVDDALAIRAGYNFDAADRRHIDDQVRGCEKHLVACVVGGIAATYFLTKEAVAVGDVVCGAADSSSERLVVIADVGLGSAITHSPAVLGVVLVAAAAGAPVLVATGGVVPARITGLGAVVGVVRLSSAGRCERVAAFSTGDYPIGAVDDLGNLSLCPGTVVAATGAGASAYTTTTTNATPTTIATLTLEAMKVYAITVEGLAVSSGVKAAFKSVLPVETESGAAIWSGSVIRAYGKLEPWELTIDPTALTIAIQVTGAIEETVNWSVRISTQDVAGLSA